MTTEHTQNHKRHKETKKSRATELIGQLGQYDGSVEQFLTHLLTCQCFLGNAQAGAILRNSQGRGVDVLAIYPALEKGAAAPIWLRQSAELVRDAGTLDGAAAYPFDRTDRLLGQPAEHHIIAVPFTMADTGQVVAVFMVSADDITLLEASRERLELTSRLLALSEAHLTHQNRQEGVMRLQRAIQTLSAVNQHDRFRGATMALCNEVAGQWQCERVSIGFLAGRYVQLRAMSHTEDFSRKMRIVQDLESAMEECLDQDCEVAYPASEGATYISRATGELSKQHGLLAILSMPLRRNGEPRAVLTLERPADRPFTLEEIETARLACELCTPRLLSLHEHDRWIGARAAAGMRKVMSTLVGPTHTWAKITVVLLFAIAAFLIFGKGQFRPEAPFVLEAVYQQTVPAPFDGYIKSVTVEVGDAVEADKSTLAELDTAELRLRLAAAKAEQAGYLKQVAAAMRDGETAQAQIAQANADRAEAQIDLLNYLISEANIVSPMSGTVVKGDLKREIGAPVKTGDVLFEVTPLESLRAVLMVSEDCIFDIKVGQEGSLATVSYPAQKIEFVVERINPMAEIVNNRNVFKVRARLLETRPWMRPGMEGVARVSVGKRRYAWIWSRKIVNWVRMKLWL
jgi:multidrug resistance efflux pump